MYYVCETWKMLENVVKRSEFVYTREQCYAKVIYYYYYYKTEDVAVVEFMYLVSTGDAGENHCRQLGSLLFCLQV